MNKQDWTYKKLGDLFDIGSSKRVYESQWKNAGVPFYRAREIVKLSRDGYVDNDLFIDEELYEKYANKYGIPKCGDLMVTGVGTLGVCYIVRENDKFYFKDGNILWFKSKEGTNPFYVNYAFKSNYLRQQIENCNGATVGTFTIVRAKKTTIPVPPVAEQERIVAELDLLSGIIEKKKEQLKAYDQLAQSIFYTMFGDPIDNPKGWEVKCMVELFDIGSSKRVFESQWQNEGIPFYRAREIVKFAKNEPIDSPIFVSEELYSEYAGKYGVPSKGDIMVTAVGTLGVCYIVKAEDRFYFKDGNILWFKSKGLCESRFIKDQYATPFVMDQIQGNANAAVVGTYTITNAKKTKVIVPPLQLQKDYVQKIEAIERQKALVQQSIEETQTMFDCTMDKYFG